MPRTSRNGPGPGAELPGTLRRSSKEAQEAFAAARARAVSTYGEGDEAQRVAYATLKANFEKRGDHWIAKVPDPADAGGEPGELRLG